VDALTLRIRTIVARVRRHRAALVALLCTMLAPSLGAQTSDIEFAVKATYLYKFAPFVEWPAGTFTSPADPFVICIAGEDGVAALVDEAVRGQSVGGHPMTDVHLDDRSAARCNMLYVAERGARAAAILDRVRGTPVLTVTDNAGAAHGVINFVVQDNRVRFEIDQNAASANHLAISSKLLNLAARVVPRP
jgi:hypothetical protein